jgi:hypothetical protein
MWTRIRLLSGWALAPLYLLFARPTGSLMIAGLAVALLGIFVRGWAAGAIRKNSVLTTYGPYAFTRNPLYLGSFLIGLGVAIASGVLWILVLFAVVFALVYGRTMRREEKRLASLFGEEFERYSRAVPRFVPRPARWSDVTGHTSPARPRNAPVDADGGAAVMTPVVVHGPFQLRRYFGHREYQTVLGLGAMFLALAAKLAF